MVTYPKVSPSDRVLRGLDFQSNVSWYTWLPHLINYQGDIWGDSSSDTHHFWMVRYPIWPFSGYCKLICSATRRYQPVNNTPEKHQYYANSSSGIQCRRQHIYHPCQRESSEHNIKDPTIIFSPIRKIFPSHNILKEKPRDCPRHVVNGSCGWYLTQARKDKTIYSEWNNTIDLSD